VGHQAATTLVLPAYSKGRGAFSFLEGKVFFILALHTQRANVATDDGLKICKKSRMDLQFGVIFTQDPIKTHVQMPSKQRAITKAARLSY
jgi:hypothetical protein